MSITIKLVVVAAVVALVGGLGGAGTLTADAATPGCGPSCVNTSPVLYGSGFVLAVRNQQAVVGQPIVLAPASNSDPREDFFLSFQGLVSDFIAAGLVSPGLSPYNDKNVYEFEYTPNGVGTGTCIGVGVTPGNNTPVDLEPCGVSAKTVWILNPAPGGATAALMSAATSTNFANPYSLTDLKPGANRQLFTWPLDAGGIVHNPFTNQLWSFTSS